MKTISRVLINFNFSHFRFFENNQKDFQIENLILAVYYGKWDNTLISYSIPIEKEIQNWQIQYWNRFKKDTDSNEGLKSFWKSPNES